MFDTAWAIVKSNRYVIVICQIEFLAEGFNIFNRTQVTDVNNRMYVLSASGSNVIATFDPTFGTASNLSNGFFFRERQIQLAVRFEF